MYSHSPPTYLSVQDRDLTEDPACNDGHSTTLAESRGH